MENLAFLFIAGYIGDAIMIYLTYRDFKRAQGAAGTRDVVGDVASFRAMAQGPSTNVRRGERKTRARVTSTSHRAD